ncbi:AraC family transcriptional regulator [Metabacillus malikii]|uniref:AraC-like DNA-binding protein n=1 Tax=Metabacillus malikii TaxID=1504265 RepID=A0ABT9ZD42_9BACI|nr:AraC family transcriptional regulator [Metabacillus malikii]MDQ0230186.1 AraC-like DNA-binding protein [Metabacillus malikii]
MNQSNELVELIERLAKTDGTHETEIPGLRFIKTSQTSEPIHTVYEPSLCVIAQGSKVVMLGEESYQYDSASYLTASVHLPITGQVIKASQEEPYLSVHIPLDMRQMFEVLQSAKQTKSTHTSGRGLEITPISDSLLEAILRLIKLLDTPEDIPVLAASVQREIIYRLFQNDHNYTLRRVALVGSQSQRIAKVIEQLNNDFTKALKVEELAKEANMSPSSFYSYFKKVTGMSPIQYQKQLRLQEARRLLLTENLEAAEAAFQVGYESPSHFSREYSRKFGQSPIRDIQKLRQTL